MPKPKPGSPWEGDVCTMPDGTTVAVIDNKPVPALKVIWLESVPQDPEHKGGKWEVV